MSPHQGLRSKRLPEPVPFRSLLALKRDNLKAAQKGQNHIREYRKLMQAWRNVGIITCAGYILGFPGDNKARIIRDIKTIQQELPVDILEFFFLTLLPGSQDHKVLAENGTPMDADMNKYDLKHDTMSQQEWEDAYCSAWDTYFSTEHITTIMKRGRNPAEFYW